MQKIVAVCVLFGLSFHINVLAEEAGMPQFAEFSQMRFQTFPPEIVEIRARIFFLVRKIKSVIPKLAFERGFEKGELQSGVTFVDSLPFPQFQYNHFDVKFGNDSESTDIFGWEPKLECLRRAKLTVPFCRWDSPTAVNERVLIGFKISWPRRK